jgi:regulator of sigma E protease
MSFKFLFSIATLSLIIFIHEFGHYIAARLCGIGVETFSVGFGNPIYSFINKKGTKWQFCILPLGGYIQPKEKDIVDHRKVSGLNFNDAGLIKGSLIAFAGPFFNFISAFMLIFFLAIFMGFPKFSSEIKTVSMNSPAYGKLIAGDVILQINEVQIENKIIQAENPVIVINRNENILSVEITKKLTEPYGLVMKNKFEKLPFFESFNVSMHYIIKSIYLTLTTAWKAFSSFNIQGPIGIINTAINTQKEGFASFIMFVVSVSIGIGSLNLLPIPALDGGRIILLIISALIRRPISLRIQKLLSYISLMIIGVMFLIGFWIDIKEILI